MLPKKSKKAKKIKETCIYIFKVGKRKGEECGKTCRGDYCFRHKEIYLIKKKENDTKYNEKRYEKLRNKTLEKKIDNLQIYGKINKKFISIKKRKLQRLKEMIHLTKNKYYSCQKLLDPDFNAPQGYKDYMVINFEEKGNIEQIKEKYYQEINNLVKKGKILEKTIKKLEKILEE